MAFVIVSSTTYPGFSQPPGPLPAFIAQNLQSGADVTDRARRAISWFQSDVVFRSRV